MVEYEWTIEERTVYEDGSSDIENHNFADSLDQYTDSNLAEVDGINFTLTLIRRDHHCGNWIGEEAETTRNELGELVLPEMLHDVNGDETRKVPARFHAELKKRQRKLAKTK